MNRTLLPPLVAALSLLSTSSARAQLSGDAAAASALFYEARSMMADGRYAEACPKLEDSLRLAEGVGTRFNLADCHEHVGKLATAWAEFVEAASRARALGQAQREKVARERARALEPRLPKLVVEVPAPDGGTEVRRDGVIVETATWGAALPVDPGVHTIRAEAPGKLPWETTLEAREGAVVRTVVPRTAPAPVTAPAPAPVVAAPASPPAALQHHDPTASRARESGAVVVAQGPAPVLEAALPASGSSSAGNAGLLAPSPEPTEPREGGGAQRTIGGIMLGLGAVGLGLGGYFGLRSLASRRDARPHCNGDLCDATGVDLRDRAIRAGNFATAATIAAGVALTGGVVLLLTAPRRRDGIAWHAATQVGVGSAGLVIGASLE